MQVIQYSRAWHIGSCGARRCGSIFPPPPPPKKKKPLRWRRVSMLYAVKHWVIWSEIWIRVSNRNYKGLTRGVECNPGVSDTHIQEEQTRSSTQPWKWSQASVYHAMKDKRLVECSKKSTVITNSRFEVSADLNGTTDSNQRDIEKKLHPGPRKILQRNILNRVASPGPVIYSTNHWRASTF